MTYKQEKKCKHITLKALQAELRHLPEPEVPQDLGAKLLAAIPKTRAKSPPDNRLRWYTACDFGLTAVAAVLIFALMFLVDYSLSVSSEPPFTEFDTFLCDTRWGQNNLLCDQNNAYIEKSSPYELKWPIINRNEGGL